MNSETRVWIEQIRPVGIHGFMGERSLEGLQPGLNIVYGPNAIGKSTLAKAITLVFQPKGLGSSGRLTGVANDGGAPVTLDINKGQTTWNGFPEQRGRYLLDIAGLLEGMNNDERDAITRLIGSGLRKPEKLSPARRKKCDPLDELRDIRKSRQAVLEDENRLAGLNNQLAQAEQAQSVIDQVNRLLEKRNLKRSMEELDKQIDDLLSEHPGLEKLSPNASEQLRREGKNSDSCQRDVDRAEKQLVSDGIDPETPNRVLKTPDASSLASIAEEISVRKSKVSEAERDVNNLKAKAREAKGNLTKLTGWEAEDLPSFSFADVEQFREIATEEDDYKREQLKAEAYRRVLERWTQNHGGKSLPNPDAVKGAINDWLTVEPRVAQSTAADHGKLLSVLCVAGIAVLTIVAALLPNTIPAMAKLIGLGAISVVLAYLAGQSKKPQGPVEAGETLAEARARVAKDPLNKNSSPGEVLTWMQKVADAEALTKAEELIQALQVADPVTPVSRRLREEKGIQTETISLRAVSDALYVYQESLRQLAVDESELKDKQTALSQLRTQLKELFASNGYATESAVPEREIDGFRQRFVLIGRLDDAKERRDEATKSLEQFWASNGFELVPEKEREATLHKRAELKKTLTRLETNQQVNEQALSQLRTADLPADWEQKNDDELETIRTEQERLAADHTKLAGEVREIENEITRAQKNEDYQRLAAKLAEDQQFREVAFQGQARAIVKNRLDRFLLEQLKTQSVPPLIERANDYLSRFSNKRYRLFLNPDVTEDQLGNLRLQDLTTGRLQAFNELSTGTKMHSLIAIRLGLIDLQEKSANGGTRKFPVIADEVLAVSDPEASKAVAEALFEISLERQVIVFTNQPDDVAVFESVDSSVNVQPLVMGEDVPEATGTTLTLPIYREMPRPRRLNLAIPLDAHDPAAFGAGISMTPELASILQKLEPMREELKERILTWEVIQASDYISATYAERAEQICLEAGGSAAQFLLGLAELKGFRKDTLQSVRELLEGGGFLAEPPTLEKVARRVRDCLGADENQVVVNYFAALLLQSVS